MGSMRSDLIDLAVVVRRETDKAWGIEDADKAGGIIWLPKSQCEIEIEDAVKKVGTLTCPEWLAKERGLI
jgi:hypothetical protein